LTFKCQAVQAECFNLKDEGSTILRNVWNFLSNNSAPHPRKPEFSSSLLQYKCYGLNGSYFVIFMYELRYTNVNILQCYLNFLSIMRSDVGIKSNLVTLVVNSHQISLNKTNHLALFTEIIGIYCENYKDMYKYTMWIKCTVSYS